MVVDVFTHGNPRLNRQDSLYLWPVQRRPFNIGRWDYRTGLGILWPLKPLEAVVFWGSAITGGVLLLYQYV